MSPTGVRLAIQVVLHRSAARLPTLLRGIDHLDTSGLDVVVRFHNNSPGDDSRRVVDEWGLRLPHTFTESVDGNIGFGTAHNRLAQSGDAVDYILLLNPDTIPFFDVARRLVEVAQARPRAVLIEAAQFPVEHQKAYDIDTLETNWCCAACLLIRADAFAALGGFDERIFLYCEDVDLSWRVWASGGQCLYVPTARCVHVSQEEDAGKDRTAEIRNMHIGDLYLRRKWFDAAAVAEHIHHLTVWVGDEETSRLVESVDRMGPPSPAPPRPERAVLNPDHINYGPIRW